MADAEWVVEAHLDRSPFPGRPTLAEERFVPLARDVEFGTMTELAPRSCRRILVNALEHAELVERVVGAVLQHVPARAVAFVRLAMPAFVRLPAGLLRPNVLLLTEVDASYQAARRRGQYAVAIAQDIRRTLTDDGRNELGLRWNLPTNEHDAHRTAADAVAENLKRLGFAVSSSTASESCG